MAIYDGSPDRQIASGVGIGGDEVVGNVAQQDGAMEPSGQRGQAVTHNPYYTGRPRTPLHSSRHIPLDRQELIRRIKSRESRPTSPELEPTPSVDDLLRKIHGRESRPSSPALERVHSAQSAGRRSPAPASGAPETQHTCPHSSESQTDNEAIGLQIERPRSALHRGDFREREERTSSLSRFADAVADDNVPSLSTSPVAPWHPDFPAAVFRHARPQRQCPPSPPLPIQRSLRSRATSHASFASSFAYQPPTSPLVQSSRPDTPEPGPRQQSRSPDKSRRHTLPPQSLQSALDYPASARSHNTAHPPLPRTERTFAYQAHQPRRSLTTFQSLLHTPVSAARRPSFSDSPLHHAPLVGSYEESILRGRMSTTPSKPLNFVAQIGVLGKGDCKSILRCPPHATIPFPAVFYSYGVGGSATDEPSPYVGLVDLENNMPGAEATPVKRRQRPAAAALSEDGSRANSRTRDDVSASEAHARRRRRQKEKRRSASPKSPPGGSYRIPMQGQLQIILKNPNKTAVKLFLVPYDLSDMEPGTKTFIRQRSYSAGPIIDMPLSSRKNLGTDRPEAALNATDDPNERPMLRYLVHLHICCPAKGRFFLYKSIRVVFANRVPDGKEKLRNEIQLPEPRYSAYKPARDPSGGVAASGVAANDGVKRGVAFEPATPPPSQHRRFMAQSLPSADCGPGFDLPMPALPFHCNATMPALESRPASRGMSSDGMDIDSNRSQETLVARSLSPLSPDRDAGERVLSADVMALEDSLSFERDRSRERQGEGGWGEGLLSRRLRELAMRKGEAGE
ncbi:hypothetical protein LTR08_001530 [Meristemomyces frigidus]|nr:hypothetical protein LTR08_001530 [Meristemomyces frigidus]